MRRSSGDGPHALSSIYKPPIQTHSVSGSRALFVPLSCAHRGDLPGYAEFERADGKAVEGQSLE